MTNTTFPTGVALRTRALSTSPFAVPMAGDNWLLNHNSIVATMRTVVTPGSPQRANYGAAKQAAPPRGVPR